MYFSKQISFFCKTMKRRLANVLEVYRPLFENKHKTMLGKGRFQMNPHEWAQNPIRLIYGIRALQLGFKCSHLGNRTILQKVL